MRGAMSMCSGDTRIAGALGIRNILITNENYTAQYLAFELSFARRLTVARHLLMIQDVMLDRTLRRPLCDHQPESKTLTGRISAWSNYAAMFVGTQGVT